MMKLYVYDHCPFCIKARMIFGLKGILFDLIYLSNDDEKTPISFIGKKMVPILEKKDGVYMPESMDIINYVDLLDGNPIINRSINSNDLSIFLENVSPIASKLLKPRYIMYPFNEFKTKEAIFYFRNKKENYLGEFDKLISDTSIYLDELYFHMDNLENFIKSDRFFNGILSYDDFNLFPLLRNLTIVKDIKFPNKINNYVNSMSILAKVPLLTDNSI